MSDISIDASHDPVRRSWIDSANSAETDFPLQNLPLGMARDSGGDLSAVVAIGSMVLDIGGATETGLLDAVPLELLVGEGRLNRLLASPATVLTGLRHAVAGLLERGSVAEEQIRSEAGLLRSANEVELVTPTQVGSFSDFFAGINHAQKASEVVKGTDVAPNYRWVPIAYHSRGSTVRPSGHDVKRPVGQIPVDEATPRFGPCEKLDYELELGFYVGAETPDEEPLPIAEAERHIAGFCLLNDWSARDIQSWEMWPLGPFLAKNFATTISPWIVTMDALRPFRAPVMGRSEAEPKPLPYLYDQGDQEEGALAVGLSIGLRTERMRANDEDSFLLAHSDTEYLYWTPAQMLVHHTSSGCGLQSGDLLGTGTVSGRERDERGSLLEATEDGRDPIELPNGERRGYLEDGDEIYLAARCEREGFASIGFGECRAKVVARPNS